MDFEHPADAQKAMDSLQSTGIQAQMAKVSKVCTSFIGSCLSLSVSLLALIGVVSHALCLSTSSINSCFSDSVFLSIVRVVSPVLYASISYTLVKIVSSAIKVVCL